MRMKMRHDMNGIFMPKEKSRKNPGRKLPGFLI
jgi:hypothetical protein